MVEWDFCRSKHAFHFPKIHHLVWYHYLGARTCPQSLGSIGQTTQCKVVQTWLWTWMVLEYFGEPNQLGLRWNFARSSHIAWVSCWNFPGIYWEHFLLKYFKSLIWAERVLRGFAHDFEHDHVLKLIYMENICPLSFPKFSQIFLKHLNIFSL